MKQVAVNKQGIDLEKGVFYSHGFEHKIQDGEKVDVSSEGLTRCSKCNITELHVSMESNGIDGTYIMVRCPKCNALVYGYYRVEPVKVLPKVSPKMALENISGRSE